MHIYKNKLKYLFLVWNILFLSISINAQKPDSTMKVTGKVLDASTGSALAGVTIAVPGFSSAITNDSGYFALKVPDFSATLLVSGMGYKSKETALKGRTSINLSLYESTYNSLYDKANLPEGPITMNRTINAVSSLNSSLDNWKQSGETPEKDLQGKIAGLNVVSRSGMPGAGGDLFLRGYTSLYATNHPLVIVDGMPYDMNDDGNSIIHDYFSNPLTNIDPKDIDNITVIKDASSIYGSKAGNGVIYITTSHAKEQATKIDFNVSGGLNYSPKQYPLLDADNYRIYLSDLLKTNGFTDAQIQALPYINNDPTNPGYYAHHNNTNWQDQVLQNSSSSDYYLKVTGGDETAVYGLSLGYLSQKGIVKTTDYSRYNVRFNGDIELSKKMKVGTNLALTYGQHTLADEGISDKTNPIFLSLIKAPFLHPNEISDQNKISPNLADVDTFHVGNPAAAFSKMVSSNSNYRFFGTFNIAYDITPAFKFTSIFGLTSDKIRENTFKPHTGFVADTLVNALAIRTSKYYVQRLLSLYNDSRLTFHKEFNRVHDVTLMAGFRYNTNKNEQDIDIGFNSATDDLKTIGDGDASLRQTGGQINQWNWMSGYMAFNYAYNSKYFVSADLGMDGSSRFGKDISGALSLNGNKYGVFPSVGAAWLVSSENFMSSVRFVELFKLRASYGITGNDDIGNYNTQQLYGSQNLYSLFGLVRSNIANPSLQWEVNKKFNVGADLSLFNERVSMSLDVYRNTIDHMLTHEQQPAYVGMPYIITNNGGMKSKGAEFTLNGRVLNGKVKLDLGFSIAYNKNKITKIPGDSLLTSYAGATMLTTVNGPMAGFYGYRTNGIYATDADADPSKSKLLKRMPNGDLVPFRGGDVRFIDSNGDGIIDAKDRRIIGDPSPEFTGMFSTRLSWNRFTLDGYFTYSVGNDIYNYTRYRLESMSGYENQTPAVMNRWRVDGQITDMPRAEWGDPYGNNRFSDRWIEDGSYIRLKCLSLSYDLPLKGKQIKYATLYASAYNLLTLTKYKGYDPEFNVNSSALLQGMDVGMVPQYKTIMVGFKIGL